MLEESQVMSKTALPTTPRPETARAWRLAGCSLLTVVASWLLLPSFVWAGGKIEPPGIAIMLAVSVVSAVAFVRCPRRCVLPKLITFVLLWPGLFLALSVFIHVFGDSLLRVSGSWR